jgi:hypothetical protein
MIIAYLKMEMVPIEPSLLQDICPSFFDLDILKLG